MVERRLKMTEASVPMSDPIGLIAGNRSLPLLFARQARKMGAARIVVVAFEGQTDPGLVELVDDIIWIKVGQLGKLLAAFQERQVRRCVMLGQIAPSSLFDLRPDFRAMGLLLRLKEKNAHSIFGALAEELQKGGIELITPIPWLKPLMAPAGFLLGPSLTETEREDVRFGFGIAKEISRLEIGQLVVVKAGTVLAVEGFEGTDKCLARGGELAGRDGGAIAVKVAKEQHDMRFDIPCIGPKSLETCAAARIRVLAIEAEKNLVIEQEEVERLAKRHRITVLTTA